MPSKKDSRPLSRSRSRRKARALGFDLCGISPVGDFPELKFLPQWLDRGYAGEMAYLARSAGRRADVRNVLPSARSVIVTGTIYNVDRPYSIEIADPARAHVARYAWGDDYHEVIERRLDALIEWMRGASANPFEARRYVDTGPVQERVYAQHAGVGWIGKNTCIINPDIGSWLFLGEIICSLRARRRCAGAGSVRRVHAVHRGVPDAGDCRAGRARLDPVHLLPDDRSARPDSAGAAAGDRIARLRLRRLPGGLSCGILAPCARTSADPAWQPARGMGYDADVGARRDE